MPILIDSLPDALEEFPLTLPTRLYLGDSGIVLAGGDEDIIDAYGCMWEAGGKDLWGPKPAPREQVGDRDYDHGQWDATIYYGPRVNPVTGGVRAPSHSALHAAKQRFYDTVVIAAMKVRGTEPGFDSWAMMRQQGEIDWFEDGTPSAPHATFSVGLYARDPQLYSSLERPFGPIPFPSVSGGLTLPFSLPVTIASTVVSGSVQLANPGSLPAPLQLQVNGPLDGGSIAFPDLALALNLDNPNGPVLTAGQWLAIDAATGHVWLNGDALRDGWVYGDWPVLPPGETTTLAIAGTGFTSASSVSGTYRAARI